MGTLPTTILGNILGTIPNNVANTIATTILGTIRCLVLSRVPTTIRVYRGLIEAP